MLWIRISYKIIREFLNNISPYYNWHITSNWFQNISRGEFINVLRCVKRIPLSATNRILLFIFLAGHFAVSASLYIVQSIIRIIYTTWVTSNKQTFQHVSTACHFLNKRRCKRKMATYIRSISLGALRWKWTNHKYILYIIPFLYGNIFHST